MMMMIMMMIDDDDDDEDADNFIRRSNGLQSVACQRQQRNSYHIKVFFDLVVALSSSLIPSASSSNLLPHPRVAVTAIPTNPSPAPLESAASK